MRKHFGRTVQLLDSIENKTWRIIIKDWLGVRMFGQSCRFFLSINRWLIIKGTSCMQFSHISEKLARRDGRMTSSAIFTNSVWYPKMEDLASVTAAKCNTSLDRCVWVSHICQVQTLSQSLLLHTSSNGQTLHSQQPDAHCEEFEQTDPLGSFVGAGVGWGVGAWRALFRQRLISQNSLWRTKKILTSGGCRCWTSRR